ncbi:MAG: putative nitrate/sulfonate/bicarbonate transporter permease protein [Bacillota bacterium]|nr:putative nitrate/sulfonate/bicarbonate transporter permease protein [Bacillota bacterium]
MSINLLKNSSILAPSLKRGRPSLNKIPSQHNILNIRNLRPALHNISNTRYLLSILFTVSGLLLAQLANWYFPQLAESEIKIYEINLFEAALFKLNIMGAYSIVLFAMIFIYLVIGVYSYFDPDRRIEYIQRAPFRFVSGIGLALWDILGTKTLLLPQPFFPGPSRILEALLMEGGFIFENTLYSLRLFTAGFVSGVVIGVVTGILIGWFPKIYYWVYPVLKITGVIPAVAWMPFALTLFPTPFLAATFLIVISAWFPVAFLTAQGIASTQKVYYEVAKTLGARTSFLVFRVAIPNAMPHIFTGISTANAYAFTTLVISEMMGQPGGLGYYINASRVWSAYYKVFAAIIIMAILFSLIMWGIGVIQRWALRWQRGLVK